MRAITIVKPGGPEVLTEQEVSDPTPAPGEVIVEIAATALNRADVLQRQGKYPPPTGAPEYLGLECSGRIREVGEDVTEWNTVDEVCALQTGGGYADAVAVPAGQLLPVPNGIGLVEAGALPEAVCTVWSNVFSLARLQPGGVLLVHGGSGGIGTMALQLARAYGAMAYCTANAAKAERLAAYGAARVIDYCTEDFVSVVNELTRGRGADVIVDHVAGSYLSRDLGCLALDGRIVVIGAQSGKRAELDIAALLSKRASVIGSTLRSRPLAEKAEIVSQVRDHVWPLLEAGHVHPVIDRAFALADPAEAHAYFEGGGHTGKVLLVR